MLHDQVGRTHTYRLNAEHLAAGPITALSRLTASFLVVRLETHLKGWGEELAYAAVFGSAATGRMTLDSDIDLFLVRACGIDRREDLQWEERLTELAVIAGRMSKTIEFFDAAELLGKEMANAAGDLYVDAGIAAADVICCVRLNVHSNTGNRNEAVALLKQADSGSERHVNTLLNLKNKATYTHQDLTSVELKKMNCASRAAGGGGETGGGIAHMTVLPWPPGQTGWQKRGHGRGCCLRHLRPLA